MSGYTYRTVDGSFMDWAEGLSDFTEGHELSLRANQEFDKLYFENWYSIPKLEVFRHVKRLRLVDWHEGKIRALLEAGGLQALEHLETQNEHVSLDGSWIDALGRHLPRGLKSLALVSAELGDEGLRALTHSSFVAQIERLQLVAVGLDAGAFPPLAGPGWPALEALFIGGEESPVDATVFEGLGRSMPKLRELSITEGHGLDAGIAKLMEGGLAGRLERLGLDYSVHDDGINALASLELPVLHELSVVGCFLGSAAADALVKLAALPTMKLLDLDGHDLTGEDATRISQAATGTVRGI